MTFAGKITAEDREDLNELLDLIEENGWVITDYDAFVDRPVSMNQFGVEFRIYKEV